MAFFYRKKIVYILFCIITAFLIFSVSDNIKSQAVSTPASSHVVVLDAGHGLPDGGAESNDGSIYESTINLSIVKKVQELLELSNCIVILTRSNEEGIYDVESDSIREKKVSDMKNRADIGNNSNAEIFVSVHLNKIAQTSCKGWQTFYKKDDENGLKLAKLIQENLNFTIQKQNKRIPEKISDIYLAKNLEIPFVVVECGFLSNYEESQKLQDEEYQEKLAWGIYTGIMDYFNEKLK